MLGILAAGLAVAAVLVGAESNPEQDRRGHVAGNDTVGIADARIVLQYIVGKRELTPVQQQLADVNGDGEVTIADARLILQFIVDKITGFPPLPGKSETTAGPTAPTYPTGSVGPGDPRPPKENTIPIVSEQGGDDPKYEGKSYNGGEPGNDNEALNQGMFGRFLLRQAENPQLPFNMTCYVSKTRREISALLPAGTDLSALVPVFTVRDGTAVTFNGNPLISGVTALDCRQTLTVAIRTGGEVTEMTIRLWTEKKEDRRMQGKAYIYEPGSDSEALNQGMFGKFLLRREENPQLPYNIECFVNKSGREITALLPAGIDITALVPVFTVPDGAAVTCGDNPVISGVTALDFYDRFTLTIQRDGGTAVNMTVRVETLYTGLPSLSIITDDMSAITSKDYYRSIAFYIGGGDPAICDYAAEAVYMTGGAKGRGNTSWNFPKKQFNIKLDSKTAVLDMPRAKDWSLINNYEDKSMLRNQLGQYLAEVAGVDYVMQQRQVDFWYNGQYMGTYVLSEKKEVDQNRVNIPAYYPGAEPGEIGYFLEFDGHCPERVGGSWNSCTRPLGGGDYMPYYHPASDKLFFQIPIGGKWVSVKNPKYMEELRYDMPHLTYIRNKVMEAVSALQDRDWSRIDQLIDVHSFVRWYIVNEFLNDVDNQFHASCFMSLAPGGKFTMGPVWDFDRSSGNCDYGNPDSNAGGLYYSGAWYHLLFEHPEARAILREEWASFYEKTADLPEVVDRFAAVISRSQVYNYRLWPTLNQRIGSNPGNVVAANTFEKQVTLLKDWLIKRRPQMNTFYNQVAQ